MAEMILRATGSTLKIISEIHVTSTQAQYDTCVFEFDEAWDSYGVRTAVFYSNPNNIKAMLLDANNRCFIPWDAFSDSRYLYIGVYGNNGESYLPTQFVQVMYQPGANVDDHLYPPTPGIYEQIAAGLSEIKIDMAGKATQQQLDQVMADIATKASSAELGALSSQLSQKAALSDVNALSQQVTSLASGSPKGVYDTLAALQTAKPSGDTGIYVVSADGKWYYWSGEAWTAGGVYQSSGVASGAVTGPALADDTQPMQSWLNLFYDPHFQDTTFEDIGRGIYKSVGKGSGAQTITIDPAQRRIVMDTTTGKVTTTIFWDYSLTGPLAGATKLSLGYTLDVTIHSASTVRYGLQYYDAAGAKIGDTLKSLTTSGSRDVMVEGAAIPEGTSYVRTMVQALTGHVVVSVSKPKMNRGSKLITVFSDDYYQHFFRKKAPTRVRTMDGLRAALIASEDVILDADITLAGSPTFTGIRSSIYGNGKVLDAAGKAGHAFIFVDSVMQLQGVTIKNGDMSCLRISGTTEAILEDCLFHTSAQSVVSVAHTSTARMIRCEVYGAAANDGINVTDSARLYASDCKVHDCFDEGISTHAASYAEVVGGEYYNCGFVVGTAGTTKEPGAPSSFGGVHLGGGLMGVVRGVTAYSNRTYGIGLINFMQPELDGRAEALNNLCHGNGSYGIFITGCKQLVVAGNRIIGNGGGIGFGKDPASAPKVASDGHVAGNVIVSNAGVAIHVADDEASDYTTTIGANDFVGNGTDQVVVPSSFGGTVL